MIDRDEPPALRVKDPVCGMSVDPATTLHHAMLDGQEYHFCSGSCRTKFVADPERYLGDQPPAVPEVYLLVCIIPKRL